MPTSDPAVAVRSTPAVERVARPRYLRETVLERLRTAIITGELAEGALFSAPMLGQALGVSATPVREAMMDLAREGLVETVKNKGFRITRMSEDDLDDLAQVRLLLEPPAMHLVAGRVTDVERTALREAAEACAAAAEREDLQQYLQFDRAFHARLLSLTGNQQLVALATELRLRTRMYGLIALARDGRLVASAQEHHDLVEQLHRGDADAAEHLLRQHIGHARALWATGTESGPSADELTRRRDT